jgi:hypothetical protein
MIAALVVALATVAAPGASQSGAPRPLSKSDLVRLLTGGTLAQEEIVELIRRHCTTFTPSERDRGELRAVGADDAMLRSIANCRRSADALVVRVPRDAVAGDAGGEAVVRVEVRHGGGTPAPRVELTLVGSGAIPGGDGRDVQATTDERGIASFTVRLGGVATHELTVATTSGARLSGRTGVTVAARPVGPLRAELRPRRVTLEPERDGTLAVTLRDALGNTVPGVRVELVAPAGVPALQPRTTDSRGEVMFALSAGAFRGDTRLALRAGGRVVDTVEVALPARIAASRTGFASGPGQRGRVGTLLSQAVVFEVRDSSNAGVANQLVTVTGVNAVVEADRDRTDANGRVVIRVRLGERAGPATVVARVGPIERQAALVALPGPATRLRLMCGSELAGRILIPADTVSTITVTAADAYGNVVAPGSLRVAVGDRAVVDVARVAGGAEAAQVTLRGRAPGSTNLALTAAGVRADFVAVVQAGAARPCSSPARAAPPVAPSSKGEGERWAGRPAATPRPTHRTSATH